MKKCLCENSNLIIKYNYKNAKTLRANFVDQTSSEIDFIYHQ